MILLEKFGRNHFPKNAKSSLPVAVGRAFSLLRPLLQVPRSTFESKEGVGGGGVARSRYMFE